MQNEYNKMPLLAKMSEVRLVLPFKLHQILVCAAPGEGKGGCGWNKLTMAFVS